jgi:hypothetical protein
MGEVGPGRMKRKCTADPHVAEIYDQVETQLGDLEDLHPEPLGQYRGV